MRRLPEVHLQRVRLGWLAATALALLATGAGGAWLWLLRPLPEPPEPSRIAASLEALPEPPPPRRLASRLLVSHAPAPASSSARAGGASAPLPARGPRAATQHPPPAPASGLSADAGLPLAQEETAADGLPASGLRCSSEGGTFQCGTCRTDGDCPAGTGCVANRETRRFECLDSECEEDAHCFPGLVCRPVTSGATGALIRRCVPSGPRREGEPCDTLFISPAGACQEGLICHRGVCSAPCRLGEPASCPEDHTCEDGRNGPACFPDCRARGCPSGQRCKRLDEADFQCLASVSGECPETPCAEGQRCNLRLSRGHGVFWCAPLCDPLRVDSCPAGQVCGIGGATISTCYLRCDPVDPDSCGEGRECVTVTEDMTQWGCRPTFSR